MLIELNKIKAELKDVANVPKKYIYSLVQTLNDKHLQAMTETGSVVNVGKIFKPKEINKYDVVTAMVCGTPHPCVVFKVDKDFCYMLNLTSQATDFTTYQIKASRFYTGAYFTNTVIKLTKEVALSRFVGVFDNNREAEIAFDIARQYYKSLFNPKV